MTILILAACLVSLVQIGDAAFGCHHARKADRRLGRYLAARRAAR